MRKTMIAAAAMLLASCAKDIQNTDAVKQGVLDYLQARKAETGLDMSLMNVDVVSVSFAKDQARAVVMFRPKNGADAAGMRMNYTLDRKGNKWVVAGRDESGGNPHGGGGETAMPPGHPAMPQGQSPGALPPGHPPVSGKQ